MKIHAFNTKTIFLILSLSSTAKIHKCSKFQVNRTRKYGTKVTSLTRNHKQNQIERHTNKLNIKYVKKGNTNSKPPVIAIREACSYLRLSDTTDPDSICRQQGSYYLAMHTWPSYPLSTRLQPQQRILKANFSKVTSNKLQSLSNKLTGKHYSTFRRIRRIRGTMYKLYFIEQRAKGRRYRCCVNKRSSRTPYAAESFEVYSAS